MPPYAAFHLGLHCLSRYLFTEWFRLLKPLIQINLSDWACWTNCRGTECTWPKWIRGIEDWAYGTWRLSSRLKTSCEIPSKNVSISWKCHKHRLQNNPRQRILRKGQPQHNLNQATSNLVLSKLETNHKSRIQDKPPHTMGAKNKQLINNDWTNSFLGHRERVAVSTFCWPNTLYSPLEPVDSAVDKTPNIFSSQGYFLSYAMFPQGKTIRSN